MSVCHQNSVLARWTHGGNVVCRAGFGHHANGTAGCAKENTVDAARRARTGAPRWKLVQHFASFVIQPHAGYSLLAGTIDRILAKHQLQITGAVFPSELTVARRSGDHAFPLR